MVKHIREHRRKADLYLKILNKAIAVGDHQLACIVRNKLKHHNHQDYAIATPTGGVIIKFPEPSQEAAYMPPHPLEVWKGWAIGLSVFPGSLLVMLVFTLYFS